jgi:outer membrane protein TolC
MDVIYNINALKVYNQMSDILEKKLKKVSVLNQYGTAKRDKVVLAEAQFYENKASEIRTKSTLDKVKMDYKIMTGEEPVDLEIPNMNNLKLPAETKEDFVAIVLRNNSKIKQVSNEAISQKHYAIIRSLDLLPDVFTETSYTYYNLPGFMNFGMLYTGIGVSWKINDGTNRFATARKEYKNYRIADLNRSLTIKQTEQDANYAWDQYFSMLELVKATEKALKASKDSLKEVKVSVSTGTATFIDEMDVENQYLNANLNYLNAQKSLILAYYKMISMTGVGYLPVSE